MNRIFVLLSLLFLGACSKSKLNAERNDNSLYNKAFDFKDAQRLDSAFFYFNQAKDGFLEAKDSLGVAKCYLNMGIISTQSGDYFGGQEASLTAIRYFNPAKEKHYIYIIGNYNNLGLATQYLENYSQAIIFYNKSRSFASDNETKCVINNNIANVYRMEKDYKKAISIYVPLLKQATKKVEFARILSNLAFTKWLAKPNYNPLPELHEALSIRQKGKDLWGQNASFSHLTDYYFAKQPDSALHYAKEMYNTAKRINSASDQMQALHKLIQLSPPAEVKANFMRYSKLDDSVTNAHNIAKNQFAVIRYETEKHKTDFLNAQAQNAEKQNNILLQRFMMIALAIGILITVIWFRKRNRLLKQQKDLEIKNTELKFVKKIHDRVANKVYQVMAEVENIPDLNKDDILDKLEVIYSISRDISYEKIEDESDEIFGEQLQMMLKSYTSATTEISVIGNVEDFWNEVNGIAKMEIFCVLQELMTNMDKHSEATEALINFKKENNYIKINYKDNGVGIKNALKCKNGLTNTGNRIDSIFGTITFDTETERGLLIYISFPIF